MVSCGIIYKTPYQLGLGVTVYTITFFKVQSHLEKYVLTDLKLKINHLLTVRYSSIP